MTPKPYDAVVLGSGPAGEVAVSRLNAQGLRVALAEQQAIEKGMDGWAVAPLAGERIHDAALAIKTRTPLEALRDTVAQFPTFTEAYLKGVEKLDR